MNAIHIDSLYQKKLSNADDAISLIPNKAVISMGMRVATPPMLLAALEKRVRAGDIDEIKVYYLRCGDCAMNTIFQEDLLHIVRPYSSMLTKAEVELAQKGFDKGEKYINFVPITFSRYPDTIKKTTALDAFLVTVAPIDKNGYFNLGTNGDYAIELARYANKLIVEVNENMPRTAGSTLLHISEVDAAVENHAPLLEEPTQSSTELFEQIGQHVVPLIPNEATIQMGIGGVPNAICKQLIHHQDLGAHTEVITSGMIDLIKSGVLTNRKKTINPYVNVFTFALGNREVYDFIDGDPSMVCHPVSYVNNPKVIAKHRSIVSVNAFIEIDFNGQVNAEFIGHQFSGVGGQLDFMRGVHYAENGRTILASSSTAKHGEISRIVPRLKTIATDTRLDIDYIVTEYGCCQLAGKSSTERAKALINIAHPKFRDELTQQAKVNHFI